MNVTACLQRCQAGIKSYLCIMRARSFKVKVKKVAYKFGTFMHWVFFKPNNEISAADPAQVLCSLAAEPLESHTCAAVQSCHTQS